MDFYSATTKGFYLLGIHSVIPDDAVAISQQLKEELLAAETSGFIIMPDEHGYPKAVMLPPASAEFLVANERAWRDGQVSTTEWLVTRHRDELDMQVVTTLTAEQFVELLVYRQALRDLPQSEAFPDTAPPWIAEQPQ